VRSLILTLALLPVALLTACGGEEKADNSLPPMTPAEVVDHRESLIQLQAQMDSITATMGEVEALAARVQSLAVQIEGLNQQMENHRAMFEAAAHEAQERWEAGQGQSPQSGSRGFFLFLLGIVLTVAVIAAHRVFFVQDTGEFPPEAHVPGITTPPSAPPTDTESP